MFSRFSQVFKVTLQTLEAVFLREIAVSNENTAF